MPKISYIHKSQCQTPTENEVTIKIDIKGQSKKLHTKLVPKCGADSREYNFEISPS